MDCCGHAHTAAYQPAIWRMGLAPVRAPAGRGGGTARLDGSGPDGRDRLRRRSMSCANPFPSMFHTHGGKSGITSKAPPSEDLANAMRAGSLAVACLGDVPDGPILGRNPEGSLAVVRTPEPGQLYRHHLEGLARMDELVASHGVRRALCTADLEAPHKAGQPRDRR